MHIPVLLKEVIELLDPREGEFFIDGTFGGGGHANAILEKIGPTGKLLGVDWNKIGYEKCVEIASSPAPRNDGIKCIQDNFANLPEILKEKEIAAVGRLGDLPRNDRGEIKANGLLLDLGVSSDELEDSGRGFSFQKDEPLLMTYNDDEIPVKNLLRQLNRDALAKVIKDYGGENWAIKIAQAIKDRLRKKDIETSGELAQLIIDAVPKNYEHGRIHPATRTFMALRVYANHELENLEKVLKNLDKILLPKGRATIISFHSLEDRLVKNYFRDLAKEEKLEIITKKPVTASWEEVKENPRARSAKLRCAQVK